MLPNHVWPVFMQLPIHTLMSTPHSGNRETVSFQCRTFLLPPLALISSAATARQNNNKNHVLLSPIPVPGVPSQYQYRSVSFLYRLKQANLHLQYKCCRRSIGRSVAAGVLDGEGSVLTVLSSLGVCFRVSRRRRRRSVGKVLFGFSVEAKTCCPAGSWRAGSWFGLKFGMKLCRGIKVRRGWFGLVEGAFFFL